MSLSLLRGQVARDASKGFAMSCARVSPLSGIAVLSTEPATSAISKLDGRCEKPCPNPLNINPLRMRLKKGLVGFAERKYPTDHGVVGRQRGDALLVQVRLEMKYRVTVVAKCGAVSIREGRINRCV